MLGCFPGAKLRLQQNDRGHPITARQQGKLAVSRAVDRLMQELPNVVGAAMRGVLRKRGGRFHMAHPRPSAVS
jgi:hypothetical protein